MIDFNRPHIVGRELEYINAAINNGKISGNGIFTQKCQTFFENKYHFRKTLLTTSCTDALEMAAILMNLEPGDEVIVPSYTFVSSAIAFMREKAKIIFADSLDSHPNIDPCKIEQLISKKTKAIVVVHYAGVACDMEVIGEIARKHNLFIIEDAAQAIDSTFKDRQLGSFGDFAAFSFHETKNIQSGEGGLFIVNNPEFINRSEIIWEKGTNRAEFFRGETNKYGWVDIGSSFLPSEITAAFLMAQLERMDDIQSKRKKLWERYYANLQKLHQKGCIKLPFIPDFATNNGHMFYILTEDLETRGRLITFLRNHKIHAVFHYLSLHDSAYYSEKYTGAPLLNSTRFEQTLLRLPLYADLELEQIDYISEKIYQFYE